MADHQLREAERALAERPDDPGCQEELLRQRLRAGVLHHQLLELAAYCGYPGALRLIQPDADWGPQQTDQEAGDCPRCGWYLVHRVGCANSMWDEWLNGLLRWEAHRAPLRAVTYAARAGLRLLSEEGKLLPAGAPIDRQTATVLVGWIDCAQAWLDCPCATHGDAWAKTYAAPLHRDFPWLPITRMLFHPDLCARAVLRLTDPEAAEVGAAARLLSIHQDQTRTDLQMSIVFGLRDWALGVQG